MSFLNIKIKYKESFEKAKVNQKLIRKFINRRLNEWHISNAKKSKKNLDI